MDDLDKDLDVICKEFSHKHLPPEAESVDEPMDMEEECWMPTTMWPLQSHTFDMHIVMI
jgi:hypothetical protein